MSKVVIKGELPSLNEYIKAERANRYAAAKLKKRYTALCSVYARASRNSGVEFSWPCKLKFTWYTKNNRKDVNNPKQFISRIYIEKQLVRTAMIGPVEFWKKHPDIEGIEVSSFGKVRSAKGYYYKNCRNKGGYLKVCFGMNGKSVSKLVHRLVAQTFIPNPNNLPYVNHKDGDRTNNNVSNLEFCTPSYNNQYREKNGESQGHPVFAINLNTLEVSWFLSQHEASRALGTSHGNIQNVIKGNSKQTKGYWLVNANDNAVNITKHKLHDIGETRLKAKQAEDATSANFVRQVLTAYALERKLAYGEQKLA